jgi:hypothetical protein
MLLLEDLQESLDELFPNGYSLEHDNHGQLIVYTGLKLDENDDEALVPFDTEEDADIDPDLESLDDLDDGD